jgi:hypothetical protein
MSSDVPREGGDAMKGWAKYTASALAAAFIFLILEIVFLPFMFAVPFAHVSIPVYPLMRAIMPEFFEKLGY